MESKRVPDATERRRWLAPDRFATHQPYYLDQRPARSRVEAFAHLELSARAQTDLDRLAPGAIEPVLAALHRLDDRLAEENARVTRAAPAHRATDPLAHYGVGWTQGPTIDGRTLAKGPGGGAYSILHQVGRDLEGRQRAIIDGVEFRLGGDVRLDPTRLKRAAEPIRPGSESERASHLRGRERARHADRSGRRT
ncbi:hypothetical protein LG943_01405 [Streptomonospora sp. S1-112]|uniref:Uncharacterized protein n=1 Tax=Streptomonospora mangrovi TaxID=2883123 RepID=A0A9X3NIX4_9ACTN|nr:hypothetical protein [Streptomonospora mangrovi]MDA0562998.1 hypothetical protein [Streptomonospora mangrovi]